MLSDKLNIDVKIPLISLSLLLSTNDAFLVFRASCRRRHGDVPTLLVKCVSALRGAAAEAAAPTGCTKRNKTQKRKKSRT